ncbi:unnamed protein product [Didymodactylos carnosus]|uniref:Uncharacterized protein n=1 Tax=Didymodactylos carnosus TaxID=1234261 RepID=A0A8S2QRS9_9BILA|nr:unnamed protein product [Didymodactylos carnosus]CAF4121720.1 unnamed protein product [Didymodactylos carnosus]
MLMGHSCFGWRIIWQTLPEDGEVIEEFVQHYLQSCGIEWLFPVQSESYNAIYQQKDCIVRAQTVDLNSTLWGKTLAFILPLVERLQNEGVDRERDRQPSSLLNRRTLLSRATTLAVTSFSSKDLRSRVAIFIAELRSK